MSSAGRGALDVPSAIPKLFPMIPSYELAATPGCRVAMSGQFAHNPGHCGVKQTRPSGLQRLFLHTHIRTHSHTRTLQKDSHRPPNIPHQQASTLNVAPHSLLECWEVYMDIIATLCATLTTSEAHPVDLLSNAPQQIKGGGGL